jgi:CDP-diacylglycerol--serine O-phosphatidyltransferase
MSPRPRKKLDLHRTLFLLPNMITLSSVFCGFDSLRISARAQGPEDFHAAALLLVFAMFFDMLDGRVARMTKTQSAFGLQIDSLADVISFGAAPALLLYQWSLHDLGTVGLIGGFIYVACAAVRLARFNVLSMGDQGAPAKPSKYIVGLPSPGAAGILISIVVANHAAGMDLGSPRFSSLMLFVTVVLGFFMVSTVKFRSFKDVKPTWRTMMFVAFMAGSSIFVAAKLKPAFVLVWMLGVYIAIGVGETTFNLVGRLTSRKPARDSARDSVPPPAP